MPTFLLHDQDKVPELAKELEILLKTKKIGISIVVPAWNEGQTIARLAEVLKNFPYYNEVLMINDGSTDNTLEVIAHLAQQNPKIKLLNHIENSGKTAAVLTGVNAATGDLIVLLDADLLSLTHDHLIRLIYYVVKGDYAMTMLDRGSDRKAAIGWFHSFGGRIFGGERAFWKTDFIKIKFSGKERYGLEAILNLNYVKKKLKIRTIYSPDLSSLTQFDKKGVWGGLRAYQKMFDEMLQSSAGIRGYIEQGITIEEDRLEKLYKVRDNTRLKPLVSVGIAIAGMALSIGTFVVLNLRGKDKDKER